MNTVLQQPHEDLLRDVVLELAGVSGELRELVEIISGDAIAVPLVVNIDAARNPWQWKTTGGTFHSLKIDNPNGQAVAVAFSGGRAVEVGNQAADELVPAHAGKVIVRPFEVVEIGFDPAVVPVGVSHLFLTLYARQLQPAAYPFV
jgi:hypothetical protein